MTTTALVLGSTGKTGRRVVERLVQRSIPVRAASRSGAYPFDWEDRRTWHAVLHGVTAAYVSYFPDLAVPGADATVRAFTELAVQSGVRRLVLLSGRGEAGAELAEKGVQESGADWTILRSTWFNQNFSEGNFTGMVIDGEVTLPVGSVGEPFVDADDIADVAVAALTDTRHIGQLYELTGPRLLTFAQAVEEIASATGRDIRFVHIPLDDFLSALAAQGEQPEVIQLLSYLFTEVLDGRNARLADGVERALGRPPRDFREYVRHAAASAVWGASSGSGTVQVSLAQRARV